jgi:hypothetical protein
LHSWKLKQSSSFLIYFLSHSSHLSMCFFRWMPIQVFYILITSCFRLHLLKFKVAFLAILLKLEKFQTAGWCCLILSRQRQNCLEREKKEKSKNPKVYKSLNWLNLHSQKIINLKKRQWPMTIETKRLRTVKFGSFLTSLLRLKKLFAFSNSFLRQTLIFFLNFERNVRK